MKRWIFAMALILCLLLTACGGHKDPDIALTQSYFSLEEGDRNSHAAATILYEADQRNYTISHILNDQSHTDSVYYHIPSVLVAPQFVGSKVMISKIRADGAENWEIIKRTRMEVEVKENTLLQVFLSEPNVPNEMWYIEVTMPDGACYASPIPFYCEAEGNTRLHVGEKWNGRERLPSDWGEEIITTAKPVIYLYPQEECRVDVELDYRGELTCTYPKYEGAWSVTARPDGTLTDATGQEYAYLYWEGVGYKDFDFSRGFCIPGEETAAFLETALEQLGLTRREANEFIVYWLPLMETNAYNVISFQTETYEEAAKLRVDPQPDTLIRVFMAWYGTNRPVELPAQELTAPDREGFTLVEWGGAEAGN